MNFRFTALLAAALTLAALTPAQAQTSTPAKPKPAARKPAPKKPAPPPPPPEAPLPPANDEQLAAAQLIYLGEYQCEFSQVLSVARSVKAQGYIDVVFNKQLYTMKPVLSSTGARRLEDVKGKTLMIQIANKSMLMDVEAGRRLVDDCFVEEQRAARSAPPPSESLGIDPVKAAAAAASAAQAAASAAEAANAAAAAAAQAASAAAGGSTANAATTTRAANAAASAASAAGTAASAADVAATAAAAAAQPASAPR